MGLKPHQRPGPPVLLAAFTPRGFRRVGRRLDGWLPVAMPLTRLMGTWASIVKEAEATGRDPSVLRMALRVNVGLNDTTADPGFPRRGTLEQYIAYARAAAEAGVHELFVDFGQTPNTLDEIADLAGRFLTGVQAG